MRYFLRLSGFTAGLLILAGSGFAYPEFQTFVEKHSGRPVNCAMCHSHADGPEGAGSGQVGSLNSEEMNRLAAARLAFSPGTAVNSPVLNEFGNQIIQNIGKKRFLELRRSPQLLAVELDKASDLDNDGISDADEYLAGTHPLLSTHGEPLKLFMHNLERHRFHVIMIIFATLAGLYGLNNVMRGFMVRRETRSRTDR